MDTSIDTHTQHTELNRRFDRLTVVLVNQDGLFKDDIMYLLNVAQPNHKGQAHIYQHLKNILIPNAG